MRDILFRGKRVDNDEWIEGYYVFLYDTKGHKTRRIYTGCAETDCGDYYPEWFEIDPNTVGQYTGLRDKNGRLIFEGDIVKIEEKAYEVKYMLGQFFIGINMPLAYKRFDYEIISNIHDNPELLEVNYDER